MINLQIEKMAHAMSFDKKDLFQRLTKLLEEKGELSGAVLSNDIHEIIEEAVDNLLVIASIGYVIDHDSLPALQGFASLGFEQGIEQDKQTYDSTRQLLTYCMQAGIVAEDVQKHQKLATSFYKGTITNMEVIRNIERCIVTLATFLGEKANGDFDMVNAIILRKNNKWIEKSVQGLEHQAKTA